MVTISDFECDNPPPPYKHDATCLWRRNCEYNYMGISPRARILIFAFNFQDMNITTLIPSGQFSILIARDTSNWLCIYVMHETLNMCINNRYIILFDQYYNYIWTIFLGLQKSHAMFFLFFNHPLSCRCHVHISFNIDILLCI